MIKRMALFVILGMVVAVIAFAAGNPPEKKLQGKAQAAMEDFFKLYKQEKLDDAATALQKVIDLEPDYHMAYYNLGVIRLRQGREDEARIGLEKALQLKPDYSQAAQALLQVLYSLGQKASASGEFAKSSELLQKALALPNAATLANRVQAHIHYLIGFNSFNLKSYPEAREGFTKCRDLADPAKEKEAFDLYANGLYFLGVTCGIEARNQESNDCFLKYLELFKSGEHKSDFLAQANYFIGNNLFTTLSPQNSKETPEKIAEEIGKIMPYAERALALNDKLENAYVLLGNCQVYLKNYEKARDIYRQVIGLFPQSPDIESYKTFLGNLEKTIAANTAKSKTPEKKKNPPKK
jgi:tetratricopeptide (TPR) repeat protein